MRVKRKKKRNAGTQFFKSRSVECLHTGWNEPRQLWHHSLRFYATGIFPPATNWFFFFFFLSSAWKPADMWNIKGIPAGGMKAGGQLLIWLGVKRGGWNGNGREPRVSILDWATDSLCDWGSEYQKCFSVRLAVALDEGRDRDNPLSNSSYTITQPNFFFFG